MLLNDPITAGKTVKKLSSREFFDRESPDRQYHPTRDRTKDKPFRIGACHGRRDQRVQAPSVSRFQATHSTTSRRQPNRNKPRNHLRPYSPCAPPNNGSTTRRPMRKRMTLSRRVGVTSKPATSWLPTNPEGPTEHSQNWRLLPRPRRPRVSGSRRNLYRCWTH